MAKEGILFVAIPLLLAVFGFLAGPALPGGQIIGVFFLLVSSGLVFFFRDPKRNILTDTRLVLSPADGTVVGIDSDGLNDFLKEKAIRVSIFLSIFNVHINRSPVAGVVAYRAYREGIFLPAYQVKASVQNEQNEIGLKSEHGNIIVRQIAGRIARRIVCRVGPGDRIQIGQRLGMIRFGSRVEIIVPATVQLRVKLRDKVKGGLTVIGEFS